MSCKVKRLVVKFQNDFYDISEFASKHPGGVNTLKGLEDSDMTNRFMKAPPHSSAAMYLMKEYKVKPNQDLDKEITKETSQITNEYVKESNGMVNGLNGKHQISENNSNHKNDIPMHTDDSMEYLVDWSKAMLPQIRKISEHYDEWVNKPVDRPLRLFGPWYLEICSKTPWWVIPTFWMPVITYLVYLERFSNYNSDLKISPVVVDFLSGIILWTFIEYSLHRWVFHMNTNKANPWTCTFHFMLHGLHHKVPFDPYRLVFPPLPAVIIVSIFYVPLYLLTSHPLTLLAGGIFGYVCYDLIHYYLHYGNPSIWHMYQMKRYHYQHHFVHHELGFGISSPIWDFIFGTPIHLRKLKYILSWKCNM